MSSIHDQFLELAAAAIDFELSPSERAALAAHLGECPSCRHRAAGFEADQRAIAALPPLVLAPASGERIRTRVARRAPAPRSTLRTLAIAAALAVLALTALAVGAEVIRRQDRDLTDVTPTIAPDASPGIDNGLFAAGSMVNVIVTDLRVRTAPTVDDSKSAKLEPLLGRGTQLRVIEGPVRADDYDWYLIEAIGWPHRGWVAAADHDGSPWIQTPEPDNVADTLSAEEAALIAGLRDDAAIDCRPRRTDLPERATVGVECYVRAAVVTRIGLYGFPTARDATRTYLERLGSYGVTPQSGDCRARIAGDRAWQRGDGSGGPEVERVSVGASGPLVLGRIGCFLDENGTANVRVTCGTTSIGILGRDDDLADVDRWAWSSPDGSPAEGEPPGICPRDT